MKFSAKLNPFYNNRPTSLKYFILLVKHAYVIFTLFRVTDCAILSYVINFPFSYNTFFFFTFYFYESSK